DHQHPGLHTWLGIAKNKIVHQLTSLISALEFMPSRTLVKNNNPSSSCSAQVTRRLSLSSHELSISDFPENKMGFGYGDGILLI
ncbi:MAG: hypothetical protein WA997_11885, partial [Anaerolineales bacterium]